MAPKNWRLIDEKCELMVSDDNDGDEWRSESFPSLDLGFSCWKACIGVLYWWECENGYSHWVTNLESQADKNHLEGRVRPFVGGVGIYFVSMNF